MRCLETTLFLLSQKVTPEMNNILLTEVTDDGINKRTMFMIGSERAPGPYGFTASFY